MSSTSKSARSLKIAEVTNSREANANQTDQDNISDIEANGDSAESFIGLTTSQVNKVKAGTHYILWNS